MKIKCLKLVFDCFSYHANLTRFFHLLLSVLVKFNNCAGNKGVRYETNSPDFKVRADGTLYAAHQLQVPPKPPVLRVTAWDPQSLGRREAMVRFLVAEKPQHNGHKVRRFQSAFSCFILLLPVPQTCKSYVRRRLVCVAWSGLPKEVSG